MDYGRRVRRIYSKPSIMLGNSHWGSAADSKAKASSYISSFSATMPLTGNTMPLNEASPYFRGHALLVLKFTGDTPCS